MSTFWKVKKINRKWTDVVVYPSGPHLLIAKLFQPSHSCVIPTVKELSKTFWRKEDYSQAVDVNFLEGKKWLGGRWTDVVVYPRWAHALIAKLFQTSHTYVIPTVKELSRTCWRKEDYSQAVNVHFLEGKEYIIVWGQVVVCQVDHMLL